MFLKRIPPEQRLKDHYIIKNNGCWEWTGHIPKSGYGQFRIDPEARAIGAHRASWVLHKGAIPNGLFVCHSCDNRKCVNPDHLWLGTAFDNMRDAASKGRMNWDPNAPPRALPRGEKHHMTPLTKEDVINIRKSPLSGIALARKYGITNTSITRIRKRKSWRHV